MNKRFVSAWPPANAKQPFAVRFLSSSAPFRLAQGLVLLVAGLAVGLYVFACYCLGRICRKAGEEGGWLVWIPLAQFIPLLRVAQMPPWTLILFLVPLVNVVMVLLLWASICAALGKPSWLAAALFVPVVNIGLLVYLAFCDTPPRDAQEIGQKTVSNDWPEQLESWRSGMITWLTQVFSERRRADASAPVSEPASSDTGSG